jgi:hypothetical protein
VPDRHEEEVDAYAAEHEAAAQRVHRRLERRRAAVG